MVDMNFNVIGVSVDKDSCFCLRPKVTHWGEREISHINLPRENFVFNVLTIGYSDDVIAEDIAILEVMSNSVNKFAINVFMTRLKEFNDQHILFLNFRNILEKVVMDYKSFDSTITEVVGQRIQAREEKAAVGRAELRKIEEEKQAKEIALLDRRYPEYYEYDIRIFNVKMGEIIIEQAKEAFIRAIADDRHPFHTFALDLLKEASKFECKNRSLNERYELFVSKFSGAVKIWAGPVFYWYTNNDLPKAIVDKRLARQ